MHWLDSLWREIKEFFLSSSFFSNLIICHNDVWWRGWLGNWVFWVCSNTWKFKVALICSLWWVSSLSCESSIFLLSCTLTCESETIECKIGERCLARSLSISIKFEKYCIFGDGGIRCFRVTPFVESKEVIILNDKKVLPFKSIKGVGVFQQLLKGQFFHLVYARWRSRKTPL